MASQPQGDPRVLFVMNLVLSAAFVSLVLWGLDFIGSMEFTLGRVAVGTAGLMILTHLIVR